MAKKSQAKEVKNEHSGLKKFVAIFATFLVVIGVAAVAVLSKNSTTRDIVNNQKPLATATSTESMKSEPALMVLDKSGARLMSMDGKRERKLVWPDDVSRLGKTLSLIKGAEVRSGQSVWLDPGFVHASPTSVRAPDGRRTAWLGSDRRDGGTTVYVKYGNETQTYTLRQTNGRKISDAQLIGWTASQELAFIGLATSSRAVFHLDTNGTITYLSSVPDEAWLFRADQDEICYATAQVGQGIESAQTPPSFIWCMRESDQNHEFKKSGEENKAVIQSFVANNGSLAYGLDDSSVWVIADDGSHKQGAGMPIMFAGSDVLARDGERLIMYDPVLKEKRDLFAIDSDASVFYLEAATIEGAAIAN